jgi:hypothetical protein
MAKFRVTSAKWKAAVVVATGARTSQGSEDDEDSVVVRFAGFQDNVSLPDRPDRIQKETDSNVAQRNENRSDERTTSTGSIRSYFRVG